MFRQPSQPYLIMMNEYEQQIISYPLFSMNVNRIPRQACKCSWNSNIQFTRNVPQHLITFLKTVRSDGTSLNIMTVFQAPQRTFYQNSIHFSKTKLQKFMDDFTQQHCKATALMLGQENLVPGDVSTWNPNHYTNP